MAKQYITPPESYSPPDDKQPGDEFDATVRFKIEEDGKLCVQTIDGVPFEEKEEAEDAADADDTAEDTAKPAPSLKDAVAAHRMGGYQM